MDFTKEISKLAEKGMEHCRSLNDEIGKKIFLEILVHTKMIEYNKEARQAVNNIFLEFPYMRTYSRITKEVRKEMHLIAFCFSYFEHTSLYPYESQDRALELASETLEIKKSSLRNIRDMFDGHNPKQIRKGRWKTPLPPNMQKFKDDYEKKDREDVLDEAKKILGIG